MPRRTAAQRRFERGIARTQQRQPRAVANDVVEHFGQHVHALLPGQPGDDDEQGRPRVIGVRIQPELGLQCAFVGRASGRCPRGEGRGERRIVRRVPLGSVDAVDHPAHPIAAADDQPIEPHAEIGRADFGGVAGADRCDHVGQLQPRLEETDPAVAFHALDRPRCKRQFEAFEQRRVEPALEGHVVDGHHRGHAAARVKRGVAQVGQRHRRLPIVRVDKIEAHPLHRPAGDIRRRAPEGGEAASVVGPIRATRIAVRPAFAREKRGRVEHEQLVFADLARQQPRRFAQQRIPAVDHAQLARLGEDGRIAGQHRRYRHPVRCQRAGQRAGNVGEAAGLDQRHRFRRDREDGQVRGECHNRSIMSLVIRHTPLSVRRKRRASSTGSSPTTRPSGMRTPESMITFDSRALRPMLQ